MARIIISITSKGRGFDVQCSKELEKSDNAQLNQIATAIACGLAVHVMEKISKSLSKTNKGKSNVH